MGKRVQIYETPALNQLEGFRVRLGELQFMDPMERAIAARDLYDPLRAAIAAVRDEAVCEALLETVATPDGRRRRSHRMAAEELGLEVATVNSIVTRHRNWLRNVARRG